MSNYIKQDLLAVEALTCNSINDKMKIYTPEEFGYTWASKSGMATVGMAVFQASSSPRTIDTPLHKPRKRVLLTKSKPLAESAFRSNSYSDKDNLLHMDKNLLENSEILR